VRGGRGGKGKGSPTTLTIAKLFVRHSGSRRRRYAIGSEGGREKRRKERERIVSVTIWVCGATMNRN